MKANVLSEPLALVHGVKEKHKKTERLSLFSIRCKDKVGPNQHPHKGIRSEFQELPYL